MSLSITSDGEGGAVVAVKAVPGASRDQIAGLLGDRLKVRIAAPPEGGKANDAICRLIAKSVGAKPRDVLIVAGHSSAEKHVRIRGIPVETVLARLAPP